MAHFSPSKLTNKAKQMKKSAHKLARQYFFKLLKSSKGVNVKETSKFLSFIMPMTGSKVTLEKGDHIVEVYNSKTGHHQEIDAAKFELQYGAQ